MVVDQTTTKSLVQYHLLTPKFGPCIQGECLWIEKPKRPYSDAVHDRSLAPNHDTAQTIQKGKVLYITEGKICLYGSRDTIRSKYEIRSPDTDIQRRHPKAHVGTPLETPTSPIRGCLARHVARLSISKREIFGSLSLTCSQHLKLYLNPLKFEPPSSNKRWLLSAFVVLQTREQSCKPPVNITGAL